MVHRTPYDDDVYGFGPEIDQVDYSNAFVQAELDTEVYVELSKLFEAKQGGEPMVLKLQKNLYGLNQALLL